MGSNDADLKKYRPLDKLHIALSDLDFSWYPTEIDRVIGLWRDGYSIWDMEPILGREADEIAVLIMDLYRHRKIETREGGINGQTTHN